MKEPAIQLYGRLHHSLLPGRVPSRNRKISASNFRLFAISKLDPTSATDRVGGWRVPSP